MTPNKTSKQMKVGGLLMAALLVLLPALTIGTASAQLSAQQGHTSADGVNSGGNTTCEVLWNMAGYPVVNGQSADLLSNGHHRIIVHPQLIDVGVSCVNTISDAVDLTLTYESVTVSDSDVSALAVQTVSAIAGAGTNHTLSFTWNDGTNSGGANIVVIPVVMNNTTDMTPRISLWPGKVNQHNQNGIWMTDSDGVSGGWPSTTYATDYGDLKLEYCQKFWPSTTSIELCDIREEITFWTRYNTDPFVSIRDVYECITSGTAVGTSNPVITMGNPSDFPVITIPGGGGLTLAAVDPCENVVFTTGILQIFNFEQITVVEDSSNAYQQYGFGQTAVTLGQLSTDIVQEGPGDYDFNTTEDEYYDVYVSDADGTLNPNGSFVTIDGFRDAWNFNNDVGHNIDSVALSLTNGTIGYADIVTDFDLGTGLYGAWLDNDGYNERALKISDMRSTRLGDQNASITVGFCDFMLGNGYAYTNGFTGDGGSNKMCPGNSIQVGQRCLCPYSDKDDVENTVEKIVHRIVVIISYQGDDIDHQAPHDDDNCQNYCGWCGAHYCEKEPHDDQCNPDPWSIVVVTIGYQGDDIDHQAPHDDDNCQNYCGWCGAHYCEKEPHDDQCNPDPWSIVVVFIGYQGDLDREAGPHGEHNGDDDYDTEEAAGEICGICGWRIIKGGASHEKCKLVEDLGALQKCQQSMQMLSNIAGIVILTGGGDCIQGGEDTKQVADENFPWTCPYCGLGEEVTHCFCGFEALGALADGDLSILVLGDSDSNFLKGIVILSGSGDCIRGGDAATEYVCEICRSEGCTGHDADVCLDDVGNDLEEQTPDKGDEGDEGSFALLDVSEDEQLVVAGAGAGSTLSLLALALRRRLLGSPL